MHNNKVVIIQKRLPQYRKVFFELLKKKLFQQGIELILIYGIPSKQEALKQNNAHIDWAIEIVNKEIRFGSFKMLWQPCLKEIKDGDIIIVEQASHLLLNYLLMIKHLLGNIKLCFWGHGKNFQQYDSNNLGEIIKKFMSKHVHWWFAYNDLSASVIRSLGFPQEKITSVQNAIDIKSLIQSKNAITDEMCDSFKKSHNINTDNVCIYVGSIYKEKRIDFLLKACEKIKKIVPDFIILIIGAGNEDYKVKEAVKKYPWVRYLGAKFDEQKILCFKISKLLLMPGLVGLAVVDAFALETPLVTTNINYHSPEISYLIHGYNGIIINESESDNLYAKEVAYFLNNKSALDKLRKGCRISSEKYTIEAMVDRFSDGLIKALEH